MKFKKGDLIYIMSDKFDCIRRINIIGKICKIIRYDKSGLSCTIDIVGYYSYMKVYVDDLILLKEADEV